MVLFVFLFNVVLMMIVKLLENDWFVMYLVLVIVSSCGVDMFILVSCVFFVMLGNMLKMLWLCFLFSSVFCCGRYGLGLIRFILLCRMLINCGSLFSFVCLRNVLIGVI